MDSPDRLFNDVQAMVQQALVASPDGPALIGNREFLDRLDAHMMTLFRLFTDLYGCHGSILDSFVSLICTCGQSWLSRDSELKALDRERRDDTDWHTSNKMIGGVCYVDLYGGNLAGIRARIPYFQELGLTYLHLMPLFMTPEPNSDGGYAVSSYREVKPSLGTMDELRELARDLRKAGISLVIDLIFNHTSNEHEWAKRAAKGDREYEQYYWIFPDRTHPDEFEKTTREIFPDDHSGSFVQLPDGRWVWSTFYHFQWDLNYSNPAVFQAMAAEMLFLANIGVEIFRMDAVAFMWKRVGTTCESLPEVHKLLEAFNVVCRIAAPSVLFKSEAIVHPDEVASYIRNDECQLSYNPLQMALTWEALATRDVSMLSQALERRHKIPEGCSWINYVRSHDDIGWTFADEDAAELGIHGFSHRKFLNRFFVNRYPGSFARGVPFQNNPKTGDCRVSGTTASLAGLESGVGGSVERILLAYSIAMSTGGIPLIYLGDEVGQLNDYGYLSDSSKQDDSRWVHRLEYPEKRYGERPELSTDAGKLYAGFKKLIKVRKETVELGASETISFETGNLSVLGYERMASEASVLCLANFSDFPQQVSQEYFNSYRGVAIDLVSGIDHEPQRAGIYLQAHQYAWLRITSLNRQ